ncbi:MAG: hypothetical protein ABIH26_01210 [Candidatus Eisenbacteria bacterium]
MERAAPVPEGRGIEVTAQTVVEHIFDRHPETEEAFRELGLRCPDCVVCERDTLADVARFYERDVEELVTQVRRVVARL